jgi:hypothetical protein
MDISQVDKDVLSEFLARIPKSEQEIWVSEATRLANIVLRYQSLGKKRFFNKLLGKYDFTKEAYALCKEAACENSIIVVREPSRARPPSPYTLDRWSKNYNLIGLGTFFRAPSIAEPQSDKRRTSISIEAYDWIKENWRKYKNPSAFYAALKDKANEIIWKIPSKSWIYRHWKEIPKAVSVFLFEGEDAYQSKITPYVPRDMSDLDALQVLCGDHRESDVTVHIGNVKLARAWLTYWLDLRTLLIWGWYLSLTPNSEAIALAYADGIFNFGAQPFSRPEIGFYSYIYMDRGKSYRAHDIEGTVIQVHEKAADLSGKFKYFLIERSVGLVEEARIKPILAKIKNPKEKPIERTNKDFSDWEKNEFESYCGSKPSERPDAWYKLYEKHKKLSNKEYFKSPFISFEEYKVKVAERIEKHNSTVHERVNLGGISAIPIEDYKALYTTRYEIPKDLVANLLLKSKPKTIGKNGISCFRKNWHYWHDDMAKVPDGIKVQIKYTDQDYKKIWVIMPDKKMIEANLIEPVSFLNPNKEVLKQVKKIEAVNKQLIRDFHLLQHSKLRFETAEDSINKSLSNDHDLIESESPEPLSKASIHLFPTVKKSQTQNSKNKLYGNKKGRFVIMIE